MIRKATLADVLPIEDFCLRMKRRTEVVTIKVEFERARKAIRNCISSPQGFAMVSEHGGNITGVLLGVTSNWWFSSDRYASDIAFFSQRKGDGARLMDAFRQWADDKNAQLVMGMSSGQHMSTAKKFYELQGLVCVGHIFMGPKPIQVRQIRRA